jgi:heptosyltransferase-2
LLRALDGDVVWVASKTAAPLLPRIGRLTSVPEEDAESLAGQDFDLLLSLEEDPRLAQIAAKVHAKIAEGCFMPERGTFAYTANASPWFDMSLISRLGRQEADRIKSENLRSWQDFLFRMAGRRFSGEEYWIEAPSSVPAAQQDLIGLETRAGMRWPAKRWPKFEELERRLLANGWKTLRFEQMPTLEGHIRQVSRCAVVVTGDSLTMHLALALQKPTVAIFTCTSPHEIYDYGRLIKIVSPLWKRYFYTTTAAEAPGDAVSCEDVYRTVARCLENVPR